MALYILFLKVYFRIPRKSLAQAPTCIATTLGAVTQSLDRKPKHYLEATLRKERHGVCVTSVSENVTNRIRSLCSSNTSIASLHTMNFLLFNFVTDFIFTQFISLYRRREGQTGNLTEEGTFGFFSTVDRIDVGTTEY
jgi:hypothetical protein